MASFKELTKADVLKVKEIDKGLKNEFRFDCLDHSIIVKTKTCGDVTVKLLDSIVKVDMAGKVYCKYCEDHVS